MDVCYYYCNACDEKIPIDEARFDLIKDENICPYCGSHDVDYYDSNGEVEK